MQLRIARETDLANIIKVLKASLGEADLPLSEQIWRYKHINNPFGKSLVLVAEENGNIAGVRAFMRWQWQKGNKNFSAFRAVDTATHPDFQGKGIFKKLTLKAVDLGKESLDNFVFNTPNDQSRPGYLKMGWVEAGNIKVALKPALNSFWKFSDLEPEYHCNYSTGKDELFSLCENWNARLSKQPEKLFTPKSQEFLKWRYENNPLQRYEVEATSNYYIAAYIKQRKYFKEFRISELIFKEGFSRKEINAIISKMNKKFPVQVISFSPQLLYTDPLSITGNFGPILTLRDLNLLQEENDYLKTVKNWGYSLGDLELF